MQIRFVASVATGICALTGIIHLKFSTITIGFISTSETEMFLKRTSTLYWLFIMLCFLAQSCRSSSFEEDFQGDTEISGFVNAILIDSIIPLQLKFNWDSLSMHLLDENKVAAEMTISVFDAFPLEISGRGVTRKKICDFPPLHFYLPGTQRRQYGWGKHKKYKLVTHCNQRDTSEDFMMKEFVVYKLYNQLTPYSFNVQLCNATYITGSDTTRHKAFIIEDQDELAERLKAHLIEDGEPIGSHIDKQQYQQLVLFQYMIGNTDWNLSLKHNMIFVQLTENGYSVPVPYDFDYSGLVNAPYAIPHASLPISNVRQRLWQYRGGTEDDFSQAIELFKLKKQPLYDQLDKPFIPRDLQEDMRNYLGSFYDELESESGPFSRKKQDANR